MPPKYFFTLFGAFVLTVIFAVSAFLILTLAHIDFNSVAPLFFLATVGFVTCALRVLAATLLYRREDAALQVLGGFWIGWDKRGTWPFAQLVVTSQTLRIDTPEGVFTWRKEKMPRLVKEPGYLPPFWVTSLRVEPENEIPISFYPLRFSKLCEVLTELGYKISEKGS